MLAWTVRTIQATSIAEITTSAMPIAVSTDRFLLWRAAADRPLRLGNIMRAGERAVATVLHAGLAAHCRRQTPIASVTKRTILFASAPDGSRSGL
jgi:hypothetical protein